MKILVPNLLLSFDGTPFYITNHSHETFLKPMFSKNRKFSLINETEEEYWAIDNFLKNENVAQSVKDFVVSVIGEEIKPPIQKEMGWINAVFSFYGKDRKKATKYVREYYPNFKWGMVDVRHLYKEV